MNEPSDCSRATIGHIVTDVLHFWKISCRWVPHLLTEEHKKKRSGAALEFLTLYHKQGDDLIKCVVTGDEMRIYHYTPETKRQNMT